LKILYITQYFDPEPNTFKGKKLIRELEKSNIFCSVLTTYPNYPYGKVYQSYLQHSKKPMLFNEEGISVLRVPIFVSHNSNPIKRLLTYFSFCFSCIRYFNMMKKDFDAIYVYHPPITSVLAAVIISNRLNIKLITDVQDIWPESIEQSGMIKNKYLLRLIKWLFNKVLLLADHTIVQSQGFLEELTSRNVPQEKLTLIYNWGDTVIPNKTNYADKYKHFLNYDLNIVYAGNIGSAQDLESVIEGFLLSLNSIQELRIAFHLFGEGIEKEKLITKFKQDNLYFYNQVPSDEISYIYSISDAALLHLKNKLFFAKTIPSKFQGYLSAGIPIICLVPGECARLTLENRLGFVGEPENILSISEAIQTFAKSSEEERKKISQRNLDFYSNNFSLNIGAAKLKETFMDLLS